MAEGGEKPKSVEFDTAFQGRVLRTLYQDPNFCCAIAEYLDHRLFDGRVRRWLANVLLSHARRYGTGASLDAIRMRLRKDMQIGRLLHKENEGEAEAAILRLKKTVKDRSFVKDAIFEFVKNQVIRDAIIKSVDHLKIQDFESVDREVSRILNVNAARAGGVGQLYVRDLESRIERRKEAVEKGISTGTRVDEYTRAGGIWRKALGCVLGAYGSGKSSTLISFSRAAILESGAKVLYVTMELDEDMVCERFDAGFADVSLSDIIEEENVIRENVNDLGTKLGEFLVVKYFPPMSLTVSALRSHLLRLEGQIGFYPDLLVIDTCELMVPSAEVKKNDAYEDQGSVYVETRALLGERNLAGWTASQLNREGIGRGTATGKNVSDSIKKAHVCDLMLVLNQDDKEKKAMIGRIYLDKNRGGPAGFELPVAMDWSRARVVDRGV